MTKQIPFLNKIFGLERLIYSFDQNVDFRHNNTFLQNSTHGKPQKINNQTRPTRHAQSQLHKSPSSRQFGGARSQIKLPLIRKHMLPTRPLHNYNPVLFHLSTQKRAETISGPTNCKHFARTLICNIVVCASRLSLTCSGGNERAR